MFAIAKTYALEQANNLMKHSMEDFFKYIHANFYPEQDISFMEYFLKLTENEGEFVVPHTKLIEYGIITSDRSSVILEKINTLGLENEVDYQVQDILQQLKSGTKYSKLYKFTPKAFKSSLMRARKYKDQPIDPIIYANYYLLLEKIFKLYNNIFF